MKYHAFLVNITEGDAKAEVQLLDGRVRVPRDGWVGITAREAEHDDIVQAVRRNWIRVDETQPIGEEKPEAPKVKIEQPASLGSKTPPKRKEKAADKSAE